MNKVYVDPWQAAVDQASGNEGGTVRQNLKTGVVTVDGAPAGPNFQLYFLLSELTHGWVKKYERGVRAERDLRRYADGPPKLDEDRPGWDPNTGCLCVGVREGGGLGSLATYVATSWSARNAVEAQLLRPYVRLKRQGFPLVRLGFAEQTDDRGNYQPIFTVLEWKERSAFDPILGWEEPAKLIEVALPDQADGDDRPAALLPKLQPADDDIPF